MNQNQIKLLNKMKTLIRQGQRRFKYRSDRDYLYDLAEIGLKESDAWKHILWLNENFFFNDPKSNYHKEGEVLIFKKTINNYKVYIKLKIEINEKGEETVCWSFHRDWSGIKWNVIFVEITSHT